MRIDIAAGEGEVVAVVRRGSAVLHTLATDLPAGADGRPDFTAALASLRAHADTALARETAGTTVRIALLPPHVEARLLALPPLRETEAAAVVRRDAGRHFLGVAAPRVTAVAVPRRAAAAPALAVAASTAVVQEIVAATRQCGWRVASVVAAHGAWVAAARRADAGITTVIATSAGAAHVLHLADGTPVSLRRVPWQAADELVRAAGPEPGAVALFAPDPVRDRIVPALAAAGWRVHAGRRTALEAAALHVGESRLGLVTESALQERRAREQRLALRLAGGAVVLLLASAGVALWGAQRQLDAVRAERAAIRPQVQPLLAMRDSLDELHTRMASVDAVAQASPRWTFALHDLALMLPDEAHITRLHASGDTLTIEAEGAGAGTALQALRVAPSLRDARLVGVVDRELAAGETSVERFRITARLAQRRTQ